MIKGGKGGSKTLTGLRFEERTDLRSVFNQIKNYNVKGNDLFFNDALVASFYKKHNLYSKLLKDLKIHSESRLSKKLLPDETIFVRSNNILFIVEMKFQNVAGSVDEKLQTCDFKKKQYIKLFKGSKITIKYVYVLNDWFKKKEYKDTLDYIKAVGCDYFFEELPLNFLGLPKP
ncbi:hypothetical protein COT07_01510 [Candidatus Woesearchaeota archaeon CG07_land_8_20_14_0_80_44_23]|nr:MAG: hypothetical protein COT07_01510 [Candidatus Woesearchaeota archaeon CG07_land_8_20_14_0_80_44_23]